MRSTGKALMAAAVAIVVGIATMVAGVAAAARPTAAWRAPPPPTAVAGPSESACGGWDCAMQARFGAASALVATTAGQLGVVVRDRTTGAVWQAGTPTHAVWTASTIKLAIAADLLVRGRAGEVVLTATTRKSIADMLKFSANRPATALWATHGGPAALRRYQSVFGMRGVSFPTSERRWGAVKGTAKDLAALVSYVLDEMHPTDRDYLVGAMRTVHEVQQWGVWSAGPDLAPGVKDGWNVEANPDGNSHWVVNSVGFAGPDARYVVSVMYELLPGTKVTGNTLNAGVHTVSDLVATVFGAKVPASVPSNELLLHPPTS